MPADVPFLRAARAALPSDGAARFADRAAAGRRLAALLTHYRGGPALALALTPGGVVVAFELARALRLALDVFVAQEFWVRGWPAVVAGAVCEGGGLCLNAAALRLPGVVICDIWREAQRAQDQVARLVARYRGAHPPALLPRSPAILVDDGLGSGLAHLAAMRVLRRFHPQRFVVATPFGSEAALACVARTADEVVCLERAAPGSADLAARWIWPVGDDEAAELLVRTQDGQGGHSPS
ncbi:MAG TPA: phosphoribosyltransferase [Roseiflexaceae bacterium]|nr:phosphoribosyltransferase [Roseiflexaceae bacterium]